MVHVFMGDGNIFLHIYCPCHDAATTGMLLTTIITFSFKKQKLLSIIQDSSLYLLFS